MDKCSETCSGLLKHVVDPKRKCGFSFSYFCRLAQNTSACVVLELEAFGGSCSISDELHFRAILDEIHFVCQEGFNGEVNKVVQTINIPTKLNRGRGKGWGRVKVGVGFGHGQGYGRVGVSGFGFRFQE